MDVLDEILNFKRINAALATSGQPKREQFALIRDAGFQVVLNLATEQSTGFLPDEPSIVRGLGLEFYSLPVEWKNPTRHDFERFEKVLQEHAGRPVWVHCALNWRVSCFVFAHRVLHGADVEQARRDMLEIWEPDAVWQGFLEEQLGELR